VVRRSAADEEETAAALDLRDELLDAAESDDLLLPTLLLKVEHSSSVLIYC